MPNNIDAKEFSFLHKNYKWISMENIEKYANEENVQSHGLTEVT